ncbi:hypothetical protein MHBO_004729, partial [Bonamia ostreae]
MEENFDAKPKTTALENDGAEKNNAATLDENAKIVAFEKIKEHSQIWEFRKKLQNLNEKAFNKKTEKDSTIKKVNSFLRKLKSFNEHVESV